jgi:uncharacterized protein (TIGR03067 family)
MSTGSILTCFLIFALAGGLTMASAEEDLTSHLKPSDLVGTYEVVSGERFGEPEPEARIKGTTVLFTDDRVVVTDGEKKEAYSATYQLNPKSKPCRITMKSKNPPDAEPASGLIEKDGDTVRLIYALPGGDEPTNFKTKQKQLMFKMKKAK